MNSATQRTVNGIIAGVGGLLVTACLFGFWLWGRKLSGDTDGVERTLPLALVGGVLLCMGLVGVVVVSLSGVREWRSRYAGVPGGFWGLRRASRQMRGIEPCRTDEIPELRRLARCWVLWPRRRSSSLWAFYASLLLALVGTLLAEPLVIVFLYTQAGIGLTIGGGVMSLGVVTLKAAARWAKTALDARGFLHRTRRDQNDW